VVIGTGFDNLSTNNDSWKKIVTDGQVSKFELCLFAPTTLRFLEDHPGLEVDRDPYPISSITAQCDNLLQAYNRLRKRSDNIGDLHDADNLGPEEALVMAIRVHN